MESQSLKLSLNLSPPWLVGQQSNDPEKSSKLRDYIARLEQELHKVESFKRELPISALLLTNAIGRLKEEVGKNEKEQVCDLNESPRQGSEITVVVDSDKKTWMQSAQLWSSDNQTSFLHLSPKRTPDRAEDKAGALSSFTEGSEISPDREDVDRNKPVVSTPALCSKNTYEKISGLKIGDRDRGRKTFFPILPDQMKLRYGASPAPALISSSEEGTKKYRRCWSPELHRRFIDALDKLGGSQVATPRQIRDLMKVHGLTNDEVKSHLQKYRLHIRKVPNSSSYMTKPKLFSIHDVKPEISDGGVYRATASKSETSQSVSPQGPLRVAVKPVKCNSAASRCPSIEEDGEENSDSHSWAGV